MEKKQEKYFPNTISIAQRFAKRNGDEYHVFSVAVEDAATIDKWVGGAQTHRVLMDPNTFDTLRNKRLEWDFDDDHNLVGVQLT